MPCSQAPSQDEDLFKQGNNAAAPICAPTRILITTNLHFPARSAV
jgi:hypothetical protein